MIRKMLSKSGKWLNSRCAGATVVRLVRRQQSTVRISPLPSDVSEVPAITVLIDIQRATSTLTTAFANGLLEARILASVEEVKNRVEMEEEKPLLGGERNFVKIPGFDLDNSPSAYSRDVVEGQSLLFTSTNGAKALSVLPQSTTIVLGSFLNQYATRAFCAKSKTNVLLLCSGTNGERSDEDELFAGALASYLAEHCQYTFADTITRDIAHVADHAAAFPLAWHNIMTQSTNAQGLIANGLAADIDFVKQVDLYPNILPMRPAFFALRGEEHDYQSNSKNRRHQEEQQLDHDPFAKRNYLDDLALSNPGKQVVITGHTDEVDEFFNDPPFIKTAYTNW